MTREEAYEVATILNNCKEKESMNKRPTFAIYEDGYKNGDVFPSNRPNSEYIFIDYHHLTHEQIWDIFYYLKKKIMKMGNVYSPVVKRDPFKIKKVYFNPPVTVVIWEDGTKTIVRTQDDDMFDPEKGLAMAISKKVLGNNGNYYDEFKKWLEPYRESLDKLDVIYSELSKLLPYLTLNADAVAKSMKKVSDAINKNIDVEEPNYDEVGE